MWTPLTKSARREMRAAAERQKEAPVMVHGEVEVHRVRVPSPERWQRAASRALTERIQVRQVNSNGMWVATSGTEATVAYLLEILAGTVRSCSCPAGAFGDPCCKHAARYYLDAGVLELDDPDPDPPAVAASGTVSCPECSGGGVIYVRECARAGWPMPDCPACVGTGAVAPVQHRPHGHDSATLSSAA
jgi:hypothetical protein